MASTIQDSDPPPVHSENGGGRIFSHLAGSDPFPSYIDTDPLLGRVDKYTIEHLHPPTRPNSQAITAAANHSSANNLPDIATSPSQGKFLALLAYTARAKNILELGTLGGVSATWLASLNPQARITTIEYDAHHASVARENLQRAGVSDRVEVIEGAGMDVLPRLEAEIAAGKREKFGFCFIDADKSNNWNYFDFAVRMAMPGTSIVVDNVVRRGKIVDPAAQGQEAVIGARKVIEMAGQDKRVEAVVLQMCGEKSWDGFLLGVVL